MRQLLVLASVALLLLGSQAQANSGRNADALEVRHQHGFSRAEARVRVDQLLDYWAQRFGVKRAWHGDRVFVKGQFWGMDFDGVLVVRDDEVRAVANDPGTMLRGTALSYVSAKLQKYLHPTYEN